MERKTHGRGTRFALSLQVATVVVLALAATVLVIHVTEKPGFRARFDLTESGRNSLDPQTVELLRGLDEPVEVDLFFRFSARAAEAAVAEISGRTQDLLFVAGELVPESLDVTVHDLFSNEGQTVAEQRMAELDVAELQTVVVSLGERRVVLQAAPDLASVDPGSVDPRNPRPPTVTEFRGEEALAEAIVRLSTERAPRVLFATGHGEYRIDPVPTGERQALRTAARLASELRGEGFEVGTWDPVREGPVPAGCDVLAIVGATRPFNPEHFALVETYLEQGGSLLVGADDGMFMEPDGLSGFLASHGMSLERGFVNAPFRDPVRGSLLAGSQECLVLDVTEDRLSAGHPITEPLRLRERRLRFIRTRSFDRLPPPTGTLVFDLVGSPESAWRDLPDDLGRWNHAIDPGREKRQYTHLALAAEIERPDGAGKPARIVAMGAANVFDDGLLPYNLDLVRNSFNWLVDRDVRIRVAKRDPFEARIDLRRGDAYVTLWRVAVLGLPGACALIGTVIAWRRRRS